MSVHRSWSSASSRCTATPAKGRRPTWNAAAPRAVAEPLIDAFAGALADLGARVETGVFGADMQVELVNDGPVTVLLGAVSRRLLGCDGEAFRRLHDHEPVAVERHLHGLAGAAADQGAGLEARLQLRLQICRPRDHGVGIRERRSLGGVQDDRRAVGRQCHPAVAAQRGVKQAPGRDTAAFHPLDVPVPGSMRTPGRSYR